MDQLKKVAGAIDPTRDFRRRRDIKQQLEEARQVQADLRVENSEIHTAYPQLKPHLSYPTVYEEKPKSNRAFSRLVDRLKKSSDVENEVKEEPIHEHNNGLPATNWIFPTRSPRFQEQFDNRPRCAQQQSCFVGKLPREIRDMIFEYALGCGRKLYIYLRSGNITPIKGQLGILEPLQRVQRSLMSEAWYGYPLPPALTILLESKRDGPLERNYDPTLIDDSWKPLDHHCEPEGRTLKELRLPPGIVLTCKQIYDESIPILYGRNEFVLQYTYNVMVMEPLWALERLMDPYALQRFVSLEFKWFLGPLNYFCDECRDAHDRTWRILRSMSRLRRLRINFMTWKAETPWRYTKGNCCRHSLNEPLWLPEDARWISDRIGSLTQLDQFEFNFGAGLEGIELEIKVPKIKWNERGLYSPDPP